MEKLCSHIGSFLERKEYPSSSDVVSSRPLKAMYHRSQVFLPHSIKTSSILIQHEKQQLIWLLSKYCDEFLIWHLFS